MDAIMKTLKKYKKDEILNVLADASYIDDTVGKILLALLLEDSEEKYDAFHELTSALIRINDANEVDLTRSLRLIEVYGKMTNDMPGIVVLKLNFVVASIRFMGLLNDNAYGVEEANELLINVFESALKTAKELEFFEETSRIIFTILVIAKMAEFPHFDKLRELTVKYMEIDENGFDKIITDMMSAMLNADFDDEEWDEEDDEELDAIFGDDDEEWDDEEFEEDEEEEAPNAIRKATPKEKITKLF